MEAAVTCALCGLLGSIAGKFSHNTDEARKNHARIHFMQMKIFDGGITEDEILQRCFTIRKPKVERLTLSPIECRRSLMDLCLSFLKHRTKSAPVVCNMCGNGISIKDLDMFNHASAHLDIKLFKCGHCSCSSSSFSGILQHLRRVHNIEATHENFEDNTVECFDKISSLIERCFSTKYPRASERQRQFVIRSDCRGKRYPSLIHFCRSVYLQRSKPKSVDCNLCGLHISLRRFEATSMLQHAAAHLDVKLFACRHCHHSMSTKSAMIQHLKRFHHILSGNSDDFDDQSEKYHREYSDMTERCFSIAQDNLEVPSIKEKNAIRSEALVRSRAVGSKLTVERRLFYNRLTRKLSDSDGKMRCTLCSKRLLVEGSMSALLHAETHLQKPLYRCKVCGNTFKTHHIIVHHLKAKHALGLEQNYESIADEFHEEFMTMLSKCYTEEDLK